jgi:hypothetical protein
MVADVLQRPNDTCRSVYFVKYCVVSRSWIFIEYRDYVPVVKWPGREVNKLYPSSAVVKNQWSYNSSPPIFIHDVNSEKRTLCSFFILLSCIYSKRKV